ncbi:phage integrase SAM-like domain-containing protein [Prevotella sp.]|uniref:phage integrase SAM-like domain-containing protein n=1 Tax=Prevotella sp. TaxID=59823 RepID=UPI003AB9A6BF
MATVKIKFRASSVAGKEGTLYYHIIHQRKLRWISTDYHVYPEEWNAGKSSVIVSNSNNRQAHLQLIQSQIDWEMKQMQCIIHDKEIDGVSYSVDDLANEIQQLPTSQSVFMFFRQQIAKKEQMQCVGTKNNYTNAVNRFIEFRNQKDLTFSQMTADMMEMYQAWLWNRGVGQNTVSFYLRTLRTLHHKAVEAGQATSNDIFAHVQTANVRTAKRAISVKDIRKIEKLDLPRGSSLDKARDMFLFSFYLRGMAFVDMAFLKKSDLKCGLVSYNRRKTHQNLNIEWIKPMQAIIDKYAEQTKDSPYMLPILTGKETSPYTQYRKVEYNTNYNLKKIGKMIGLKIPLTTYVARHTWASIALHMNIPIATISEGMGHNSYKTTQIYLESIDVSTINEANKRIIRKILKDL